jgi:hypothetical protein
MSNKQFYIRAIFILLAFSWLTYFKLDLNSFIAGALLVQWLNSYQETKDVKKD